MILSERPSGDRNSRTVRSTTISRPQRAQTSMRSIFRCQRMFGRDGAMPGSNKGS
jgi:hypothetical protein